MGITMKHSMNEILQKIKNSLSRIDYGVYISLVVVLMALSSLLFIYGYRQSQQYAQIVEEISKVQSALEKMQTHVNNSDMGLRGYMIIKDDQFLLPVNGVNRNYQQNLDSLGYYLKIRNSPYLDRLPETRKVIIEYIGLINDLVELRRQDKVDEVIEVLKSDPGYDAWKVYAPFVNDVVAHELNDEQEAKAAFENTFQLVMWLKILLLGIGIPVLLILAIRLKKSRESREAHFGELDRNNRRYIFDAGNDFVNDEAAIIQHLSDNLRHASRFINAITQGDYSVKWEGINDHNREANQHNIAGELIKMREQMKKVREADERRLWTTEGLSRVSEISRKYQHDIEKLADSLLIYLVKYLNANQAGLFTVAGEDEENRQLELVACYAYERKKHIKKQVGIGEGLLGQAYLEGESIYMTEVPESYINITSGLGKAVPRSILIVPLTFNDQVMGVIEIASLHPMQDYQISFVEDTAEVIASSLSTVKINARTQVLLEQSQEQAETMRAQEEEMRQNMEELQATQEEMERKTAELSRFTKAIDRASVIIDFDSEGKIIHVNDKFCEVSGYRKEEALGQLHSFYVATDEIQSGAFSQLWEMLRTKDYLEKVVKRVRKNGSFFWLRAYYFPIRNEAGDLVRINCICSDISNEVDDKKKMEEELNRLRLQLTG
jgi:PAS domain S-box-containing protein